MSYTTTWDLVDKEKLSIFGVSNNRHLTLQTWEHNKPQQPGPTDPGDIRMGIIVEHSSIVAVRLRDWTRVFGWAEGRDSKSHLYMLSPVPQWIKKSATTAQKKSLAGISTGDVSWLYYLDECNRIIELPYNGIGSGIEPGRQLETHGLLDNTRLAASEGENEQRFIVYQNEAGRIQLQEADYEDGPSVTPVKGSPMLRTPLALVHYKHGHSLIDKVYYLSNESPPQLHRSTRQDGKPWNPEKLENLNKHSPPHKDTSLSAVYSTTRNEVILTYRKVDGKVTSVPDRES